MENSQKLFPFSSNMISGHSIFSSNYGSSSESHHGYDDNGFHGEQYSNRVLELKTTHLLNHGQREEEAKEQNFQSENNEKTTGKKKGEKKMRNPRHAFQTRTQVDILDDGYRWRKYGQKAVKNNKFPRSYYRCTHQGCNVKKQVQRLTKDEGIVVTTYEGVHTHPIDKPTDNFEHILSQMQIFPAPF